MIEPSLPRKIATNLSIEQVGDETLIYDETSHRAFCLNHTSASVWRLCDGAHTHTQIAVAATHELATPISEELVLFALDQLYRDGLLQTMPALPRPVLSRRELVEKLGVRALIMLPVVAAIVVPEAAQALSGGVFGSAGNRAREARARQSLFDQGAASAPKQAPAGSDPLVP